MTTSNINAAAVTSTPQTVASVLSERGRSYKDAWILIGELTNQLFVQGRTTKMMDSGFFYAWITILCKLVRALTTPNDREHWVDIAGYAQLVVDNIDKGSRGKYEQ